MLKTTMQRAAALMIAIATLNGCDAEPVAPHAESPATLSADIVNTGSGNMIYRDEGTVPHSFVVYASCANGGQGEVLQVNGQMQYRGHWLTTTQGERRHYVFIASFTGSAIGWQSGEAYDVSRSEVSQGNMDYGSDGIFDPAKICGASRCS